MFLQIAFVMARNRAYLLTVRRGNHGGRLHANDPGYRVVQSTVRTFVAAYLKGDTKAERSLQSMTQGPKSALLSSRP